MALDMPVALGCDPGSFDDAKTLLALGYFGDPANCNPRKMIEDDIQENTIWIMADDKLCYYSNVQQLFTS
ncbi:MAG: hypothetical protein IKJ04_06455, partial [Clostridia bacterium]|nr:hypothetical protein [Clostridia bacterium]